MVCEFLGYQKENSEWSYVQKIKRTHGIISEDIFSFIHPSFIAFSIVEKTESEGIETMEEIISISKF